MSQHLATKYAGKAYESLDIKERLQNHIDEIISFNGAHKNLAVGIVDIVDSTKITAHLPKQKMCTYYGIFLNSMAMIIKEYDGVVVKNVGDSLLYYFPKTSSFDKDSLAKSLKCGITMIKSSGIINQKMQEADLPSVHFRISQDFGDVMIAKSVISSGDDVFGVTVNLCTKINRMAKPDGMIIGHDLYQITKSQNQYDFKLIPGYSVGLKTLYPVYSVESSLPIPPSKRETIAKASFMNGVLVSLGQIFSL